MSTKLLSDRIRELHLRPDAPFPSEVRDGHQAVKEWRREQRIHLVEDAPADDEPDDEEDVT